MHKIDKIINKSKASNSVFEAHNYDLNLELNHIYLFGVDRGYAVSEDVAEPGVEFTMANRFIRNMNLCMRVNPTEPIVIHMKTCGGLWEEGMAIYDMIKSCPNPVTILNYTHARSMSSIIFQAATKRVMMPTSYFMFHTGTLHVGGTVKEVESNVDFNKLASKKMIDIYAENLFKQGKFQGNPLMKIKKWIKDQMDKKEDVFLTAQETINYGFADEIFNNDWTSLTKYTKEQLER